MVCLGGVVPVLPDLWSGCVSEEQEVFSPSPSTTPTPLPLSSKLGWLCTWRQQESCQLTSAPFLFLPSPRATRALSRLSLLQQSQPGASSVPE